MVKDPKGFIMLGFGIHTTRISAMLRVEGSCSYKWRQCYLWGWRIVKVQLTEIKKEGK